MDSDLKSSQQRLDRNEKDEKMQKEAVYVDLTDSLHRVITGKTKKEKKEKKGNNKKIRKRDEQEPAQHKAGKKSRAGKWWPSVKIKELTKTSDYPWESWHITQTPYTNQHLAKYNGWIHLYWRHTVVINNVIKEFVMKTKDTTF